jgi:ribosome-associated toxin RatA of RatAB toxin-antitoxin module
MKKFGGVITAQVPASAAFAALTRFSDIPKFVPAVIRARQVSSGPVMKGTFFEQVSRVMGRELTMSTEVTECEPNRVLAYRALNGPFKYRARYEFSETPQGTQIRYDVDLPISWYLWPASPILGRMWERSYARNMEAFGRYAEESAQSEESRTDEHAHAST